MVATHNVKSCEKALEKMTAYGPLFPHDKFFFGQLTGMSDHLSLALLDGGAVVCKVLPVGKIEEALPYLLRRMHENQGMMGSSREERLLLLKEIRRRLRFSK